MSQKIKRNTSGLLEHSTKLKQDTERRVMEAIDKLKRTKGAKINFQSVAQASGVSTTTLYHNKRLRARIESLRAVKEVMPPLAADKAISREHELREQIKNLRREKALLIAQLVDRDELLEENNRLKRLLFQKGDK